MVINEREVAETLNKYFGYVYKLEERIALSIAANRFSGGDEHTLRDITLSRKK